MQIKRIAQLTGHNSSIYALAKGKSKKHFLSGSGDGWVVEWTLDNPKMGKLVAKVESNIFSLLDMKDSPLLLAGNMNGGLHWVNLDNPDLTKNILQHEKGVYALLRIGDFLYSAGGAGMLTKWSIPQQRTVESFHLTNQSLRSLAYSSSRNEIAVGASDNCIYLLDADSLELKNTLKEAHENSVFCVQYSPDEKYLLSGGRDAHLKVWEVAESYKNVSSQPAHLFTVNTIAFHPNLPIFATGSRDKTIKFWDANTFKLLKVLDVIRNGCHVNSVNDLLWMENGVLVSGSDDRSLILWEIEEK